MRQHADILDESESLGKPFVGSILFHAAVFGILFAGGYSLTQKKVTWGFQNAGGGPASVAVNPVNSIPLPQRAGQVNPVANDSESRLPTPPTPPKPMPRPQPRVKAPEPNAIPLKSRNRPEPPRDAYAKNYLKQPINPHQIYSNQAPALVSPMFAKTGSGQIGVGPNGPLGTECGAYAAQIQQLVGSKWHTSTIDGRIQNAPPVIFTFNLHRDGSVDSLRRTQSSGNYDVDTSAQRALSESVPFPPINCASAGGVIEFYFQLKR